MNCIEARRMVTPFVKKELSDKETERFLNHIEHCDDCMDELDIYFTMYKAIDALDRGLHHEYDFRKMLEQEIRSARHAILRRRFTRVMRCFIMVIAEILLLFCVWTGYEMRRGELERSTFQRVVQMLQEFPQRLVKGESYLEDSQTLGDIGQSTAHDWRDKRYIVKQQELERKSPANAEQGTETEASSEKSEKEESEKEKKASESENASETEPSSETEKEKQTEKQTEKQKAKSEKKNASGAAEDGNKKISDEKKNK